MHVIGGAVPAALVLEIMLKSLLVAAAALSLTWFMRRSSAAQRHLYLSAAVVALLLLPLASLLLPSWNLALLPDALVPSREALRSAAGPAETGNPAAAAQRPSGPADTGGERADYSGGRRDARRLYPWLVVGWMAAGGLLLARLLGGKMYGYWIAHRAPAMNDDRVLDAVERVSQKVGYAREIRVVESDHLRVPFVCGLFRPRLIIPSQVKCWSIERVEAILHHEFAHIKRRDILLQFFAQLACCLYWMNPLAWFMERKLFIERERACDDIVINRDIKASEYAAYLMEAVEELGDRRSPVWVMSAMAEGTDFKDRIISVLDPAAKRTMPRTRHAAAVVLFSMLLFLPFSSLHLWAVVEPGGSGPRATEEEARPAPGAEDSQTLALITLLESPDRDVREHAATALGKIGGRRAELALVAALEDEDASVREHAAVALGSMGSERAVLPLARIAGDDRNPRVREHAATALGTLKDRRALAPLIDAARDDPDPRVREHAATAVGMVGGEDAYEALLRLYNDDGDVRVRAHAAYGLGLLADDRAFDLLIEGLGSRHAEIRAHCADALGLLGDVRAAVHLRRLLRDSSPLVRERTRRALEMLAEGRR